MNVHQRKEDFDQSLKAAWKLVDKLLEDQKPPFKVSEDMFDSVEGIKEGDPWASLLTLMALSSFISDPRMKERAYRSVAERMSEFDANHGEFLGYLARVIEPQGASHVDAVAKALCLVRRGTLGLLPLQEEDLFPKMHLLLCSKAFTTVVSKWGALRSSNIIPLQDDKRDDAEKKKATS